MKHITFNFKLAHRHKQTNKRQKETDIHGNYGYSPKTQTF